MSGDVGDMKALLTIAASGQALTRKQAKRAFEIIMSGDATPAQMGGFLMALRVRGETVEEITGAAETMRAKMLPIEAPEGAIDTCGTGGDAKGTLNISTGASLVVAACGVPVAKHGNRALTSKAGAADVLTALGVNIEADMTLVKQALWEANICFLMAPRHHSAMRHVGPTRVELGTRTIFNLLGPLSNPARVKRQTLGVFAADWVEPIAQVLKALGHERAWVFHGADGLDELSTTGASQVAELKDGEIRCFTVNPEDAGLPVAKLADLTGGDAEHNALALSALLDGAPGPFRDVVLYASAATLLVAGAAADLKDGVTQAAAAVDDGRAKECLQRLVAITNQPAEEAVP